MKTRRELLRRIDCAATWQLEYEEAFQLPGALLYLTEGLRGIPMFARVLRCHCARGVRIVCQFAALLIGTSPSRPEQHHRSKATKILFSKSVRTSHETHSFSVLRLKENVFSYKIWGFHGREYEECRLLVYKNPFRTLQETHYVSATELNQLMLCKIWGLHGGHYEECRLLVYKNPVRASQETRYVSATKSNQLMLCKIWGFHFSDYEECRLLGYKNPVRTSRVTHYVSATELSRLMLCKIWGFHGCDYEECRLLGCYAVWLL
jgi:hypothetical protein